MFLPAFFLPVLFAAALATADEPVASGGGARVAASAEDESPEGHRASRLKTMREIVRGIKLQSDEGEDRAALAVRVRATRRRGVSLAARWPRSLESRNAGGD